MVIPRPKTLIADKTLLDGSLSWLESFLSVLSFHGGSSASRLRLCISFSAFLLLAVAAPVAVVLLFDDQRNLFSTVAFEASLAAISLACVSRNLVKYGIRMFLFVDQHHGHVKRFQIEYVRKIQDFFRLLLWWIMPCFLVKATREIFRAIYIYHHSLWKSIVVFLASIFSWSYSTIIFLSACTLFNLVCNLQVIHFEDYGKLLERETDTSIILKEHMRLNYYLSKISHRFRVLLLLLFLFVTASQIVTLFEVTGYSEMVNFTTVGDLIVSSVVQVVGVVLCLNAAAKISHRAQGIASVASRWHASITCCSDDSSQLTITNSSNNLATIPSNPLKINYSESDLESLENVTVQTNTQLASDMSSFRKRQALVMYLQSNPGGITIFGWTVDRALINTIFFIEMSLVTFVLGKTIVFSAK